MGYLYRGHEHEAVPEIAMRKYLKAKTVGELVTMGAVPGGPYECGAFTRRLSRNSSAKSGRIFG